MKQLTRIFALAGLICATGTQLAQGQANDWIIPPNKHMHFTDCCNFLSTLPGSSAISPCGAGSGYEWDQYAGVVSDPNGNGMAFVNHCGIYDPNTGASIGGGASPYSFAIPGLCNQYYSLTWNTVGVGGFRHQELFFRKLDASSPSAIIEVSATSGYSNSNITPIAIAPLAEDGSRNIYISNDLFQLVSINVASNGSIGSPVVLATLPVGIWDMEVSPNGRKIVINHANYVTLYDLTTNTETALGGTFPSTTRFSGIEYVPGTGSGDRVYLSYHQMASALSFAVEGLGYVNLSAPNVLNDALTGMPGTLSKSGFGFTDIERGKNGYLYFAYHSGWASHWLLNGTSGTMYSTYPDVPSYFVPVSPSTSVSAIDQNNAGFIIQKQIDGEDYRSFTLPVPTFTVNGQSQTPTSIPTITLCDNDLLQLFITVNGYYSAGEITIEKGIITGTTFDPAGMGSYGAGPIPGGQTHQTIGLGGAFASFLAGYTGGLRITYRAFNGCGNQASSQVINLQRASTQADYLAITNPGNNFKGTKLLQKTLPINTPMPAVSLTPANTALARFKDAVAPTVGWFGASSAGVTNIITNGAYTLKVYEAMIKLDTVPLPGGGTRVDTLGVRRVISVIDPVTQVVTNYPAPDICESSSTGPIAIPGATVNFNDLSLEFADPALNPNADPRYFYDITIGNQDGYTDYFKKYYAYAKSQGPAALADFSNKLWCVEFTVNTTSGCTVKNISYFRIASSAIPLAGNASMPFTLGAAEESDAVQVFPNPTSDKVQITFQVKPESASVVLYDIHGRVVLSQAEISPDNATLDLKTLPAGMYTYTLIADGHTYHGKILKQ
jgi:hypothetical protein